MDCIRYGTSWKGSHTNIYIRLASEASIRSSWKRFFVKTGATPSLYNLVYQERRGHRGTLVPYKKGGVIGKGTVALVPYHVGLRGYGVPL